MKATTQSPHAVPTKTPHADAPVTERGKAASGCAADERCALIAQAAYLRAEKRGFAPGAEMDDWLAAEIEVDQKLNNAQPTAAAS